MDGERRILPVWAVCPLLLTALIRVLWIDVFPVDPVGSIDAEGFHLLAVNLLDGRGFTMGWAPPFCPNTVRTPLYPLFLAAIYRLVGRLPHMAVAIQVLCEVLTTAWVIVLSRAVSAGRAVHRHGSARTAPTVVVPMLAGLVYSINGTTQRYTGYLLSEALLLPVLAAALYATMHLLRRQSFTYAAGAGAAWGLAVLTKPNVQFLALAAGVLVAIKLLVVARRLHGRPCFWLPAATFWVTLCMVLLPWVVRNRQATGRWMLSSAFEDNLARVSAVATQAALSELDVEPWTETWEHLYRQLAAATGWDVRVEGKLSCDDLLRQQRDIAVAARALVWANLNIYGRDHLRSTVRSVLDPGHELWYRLLTGYDWQMTGVVSDILGRMVWSLERGAVGDALVTFWEERVARIPWGAALLWWGLVAGRAGVAGLTIRGLGRLRDQSAILLLLFGSVVYQIVLPGPIAHDRFYIPAIPVVAVLVARGAGGYNRGHDRPEGYRRPRKDTTAVGGPND